MPPQKYPKVSVALRIDWERWPALAYNLSDKLLEDIVGSRFAHDTNFMVDLSFCHIDIQKPDRWYAYNLATIGGPWTRGEIRTLSPDIIAPSYVWPIEEIVQRPSVERAVWIRHRRPRAWRALGVERGAREWSYDGPLVIKWDRNTSALAHSIIDAITPRGSGPSRARVRERRDRALRPEGSE